MRRIILILSTFFVWLLPACTITETVSYSPEYVTVTYTQLVTQTHSPPLVTVTAILPPKGQLSILYSPSGYPPDATGHAQDDVVSLMSKDFNYLANIAPAGGILREPWPVPVVKEVLKKGTSSLDVMYRQEINSPPGETRNNIIKIALGDSFLPDLSLYLRDVPQGFSFTQVGPWNTSLSILRVEVLTISIPSDAKPGKYTFLIGIVVDNIDYGAVPCTVVVTAGQ